MNIQHHSLADWDIMQDHNWDHYGRYELYSEVFVSPPSCLLITPWPLDGHVYALSNLAPAQNLPAGKMTTWAYHKGTGVGKTYFHIGVTGEGDLGIYRTIPKHTDTFHRFRMDWWQGYDGVGDPATLVNTYIWDGTNWIPVGSYTHPPITGAVNRCGIGIRPGNSPEGYYFDDTEIWLPI